MKGKVLTLLLMLFIFVQANAQYPKIENELDKKIKAFLEENASNWTDMNVPLADGKILYDIIHANKRKAGFWK